MVRWMTQTPNLWITNPFALSIELIYYLTNFQNVNICSFETDIANFIVMLYDYDAIQRVRKVTVHFSNYFFIFQILIHYYSYYNPNMVSTTEERVRFVEHVF